MSTKLNNQVLKIDALMREATAIIWHCLPAQKRSGEELQSEALRLLMRVVQNFCDDLTTFTSAAQPGEPGPYEPVRHQFPNTGKAWSAQADEELKALFESGNTITDLSLYFQRTENGIRARLVKLGLLAPDAFRSRFAAA